MTNRPTTPAHDTDADLRLRLMRVEQDQGKLVAFCRECKEERRSAEKKIVDEIMSSHRSVKEMIREMVETFASGLQRIEQRMADTEVKIDKHRKLRSRA